MRGRTMDRYGYVSIRDRMFSISFSRLSAHTSRMCLSLSVPPAMVLRSGRGVHVDVPAASVPPPPVPSRGPTLRSHRAWSEADERLRWCLCPKKKTEPRAHAGRCWLAGCASHEVRLRHAKGRERAVAIERATRRLSLRRPAN